MGILSVLSLPLVNAAEVQHVETNGTIGFTGVYDLIQRRPKLLSDHQLPKWPNQMVRCHKQTK